MNKKNNYKHFLFKRILRIDPPYLLSIILVIVLLYFSTLNPYYRGGAFHIDWLDLALHLGYLNAFFGYSWLNPVYWTLAIEFQYYILIALIFPLLIHSKKTIRYFTLILFGLSGLIILKLAFIFHFSLLFIIGILLFYLKMNLMPKKEFTFVSILVLFFIYNQLGQTIFFSSLFAFLIILFVNNKNNKIAKFSGKISYSLYLIHVPIGGRVINLFEQFTDNEFYRSIAVFIAFAVSIFSAWLFYKIIEKPSIKLSKKIKY